MRTVDIAKRAARSLRNAKTRTILTSLAIAVGAFTIAVSLAAGEGARQYADKLIGSNVNPQSLFIVKDNSLFEGGGASFGGGGLREYNPDVGMIGSGLTIEQMTQADIDELAARDDVKSVVPTYMPSVTYLEFGESDKRFVGEVMAYDPTISSEASFGSTPKLGDQLKDTEVIMPEAFATTLVEAGIVPNAKALIGTEITMTASRPTNLETNEYTFTIRGLSKQSATALTGSTSIQIPASAARAISEYTTLGTPAYQKYTGATALVADGNEPEVVKNNLEKDEFYAQTAEDLQGVIFTVVNTLQGIVLGFGVVALIASVFGIINTQYISVLERTREIGLMKALGMRGRSVSRLFQFEAAWIGFLGGIIGAIIAVSLGSLFNPAITEALGLGEGNYILIFQPIPILIMIIALMLIAMLAGWFPARKAAKLDPIEALRTE